MHRFAFGTATGWKYEAGSSGSRGPFAAEYRTRTTWRR
jgi:hypothetical protein